MKMALAFETGRWHPPSINAVVTADPLLCEIVRGWPCHSEAALETASPVWIMSIDTFQQIGPDNC